MEINGYILFSECHRVYVCGVRRAVRKYLEDVHGNDWWSKGVTPVLSEEQRRNLDRMVNREASVALENLLDTPHFGAVVCRNARAFSDTFNDPSVAFRNFQRLAQIRNEWAHVQNISLARVMQAVDMMKDILASLQRREALDIERITKDFSAESSEPVEDPAKDDDMQIVEIVDNEYDVDERAMLPMEPLDIWNRLQSFLVLDTDVTAFGDAGESARVTLRVSNTAPSGENLPDVCFNDVEVWVLSGGRDETIHLGAIEPGQESEKELTFPFVQLASTEFSLRARLDADRLFDFQRKVGLPGEVVKPILDEFVARFEALEIKEFLDEVLASISNADPTMTLQEAASLRKKLQEFQPITEQKISGLDQLFRAFTTSKRSTLGMRCIEVIQFLRELNSKIRVLDEAISQTDSDLINQAVNNLEQSQLAIIRLEHTIKGMANPDP